MPRGEIRFENVVFSYDTAEGEKKGNRRVVLDDVSFTVKPGQRVSTTNLGACARVH